MSDKWINGVAEIKKSKNGNLYIDIKEDFSVSKGDRLMLKSKKQEILDNDNLSDDRKQELLAKLEFIKYTVNIPPKKAE